MLAAGVSVFVEMGAFASDRVVCFAGESDGEDEGAGLDTALAVAGEDCGFAEDSFANGVLFDAGVDTGATVAVPVKIFPGCLEYQKAPPAINKPAATPMSKPFFDFEDPWDFVDSEESSSN